MKSKFKKIGRKLGSTKMRNELPLAKNPDRDGRGALFDSPH
jgi:hypothetical protein